MNLQNLWKDLKEKIMYHLGDAQTSLCGTPWLPKDDNSPQEAILLADIKGIFS